MDQTDRQSSMSSMSVISPQGSLLDHGVDEMELTSALMDLEFVDHAFSTAINLLYRLELLVQCVLMVLTLIFAKHLNESHISSVRGDFYVTIAFASWILELFIGWKLGYIDPVGRMINALYYRSLRLSLMNGVMYINYFFIQFGLGGLSLLSKNVNLHWTLSCVSTLLIIKLAQYCFFFVLKAWTYIFRMIPCCDWILLRVRFFMRSRPIHLFCRNNVVSGSALLKEDEMCAICHCDIKSDDNVIRLPCRHDFHHACIMQWFFISAKCPLCKQEVDLYHIPEQMPLLPSP